MKYGLRENIINEINKILSDFPEVEEAIIYGSRAKGNYKQGSDIDIVLRGTGLNLSLTNKIDLKLDDLFLPYTFDLSIFHLIKDENLIDYINRVGISFYKREKLLTHS